MIRRSRTYRGKVVSPDYIMRGDGIYEQPANFVYDAMWAFWQRVAGKRCRVKVMVEIEEEEASSDDKDGV